MEISDSGSGTPRGAVRAGRVARGAHNGFAPTGGKEIFQKFPELVTNSKAMMVFPSASGRAAPTRHSAICRLFMATYGKRTGVNPEFLGLLVESLNGDVGENGYPSCPPPFHASKMKVGHQGTSMLLIFLGLTALARYHLTGWDRYRQAAAQNANFEPSQSK